MLDAMTDTNSDGTPLFDGPARAALVQRYNNMSENELAAAEAEVVRLTEELKQLTTRSMKDNPAIQSDLLLHMVASLRDPHDTTYSHLWKGAVRIETISRVPIRVHDTAGTITRWEGTIRTAGGDHEFSAPFRGEYLDGAAAQLPGKVDEAVKNLLEGVPFEAIAQTNARGVRLALAERLGFDSRYFGLPTCRDPRLVRIAAHLAVDPGRDTHQVARLLEEPLPLVREVLSQLTSARPTWEAVDARSRTSPPAA
jgi:hypothetical protein